MTEYQNDIDHNVSLPIQDFKHSTEGVRKSVMDNQNTLDDVAHNQDIGMNII